MTSQLPEYCDANTWRVISNSLDINFIPGDIHGQSSRNHYSLVTTTPHNALRLEIELQNLVFPLFMKYFYKHLRSVQVMCIFCEKRSTYISMFLYIFKRFGTWKDLKGNTVLKRISLENCVMWFQDQDLLWRVNYNNERIYMRIGLPECVVTTIPDRRVSSTIMAWHY